MAEIGVERLCPRNRQKDGAEYDDADISFIEKESDGIVRVEGSENRQIIGNVHEADSTHHQKPHEGDRPEELRDRGGPLRLNGKKKQENYDRDWNDVVRKGGRHQFQPL